MDTGSTASNIAFTVLAHRDFPPLNRVYVCNCHITDPFWPSYLAEYFSFTGISICADALFRQLISKDQNVEHALSRLTFGTRSGDVQRVGALGRKKWIDLQLHPERIPENPALANKLQPLDTLNMSTAKMLQNYPSPQQVKEMVAGKLPFPDDPDKRMMVGRLAARLQGKTD